MGGLIVCRALLAAVGGALRVAATPPPQVADGQVLGPVVVLPVAGVPGLGLEGSGGGGLCEGDAGHRNGGQQGGAVLFAHPRSSNRSGRRGRIWEIENKAVYFKVR